MLGRNARLKEQIAARELAEDKESECTAILHLVASYPGAMAGLTNELLDEHPHHRVLMAGDEDARTKGVKEL